MKKIISVIMIVNILVFSNLPVQAAESTQSWINEDSILVDSGYTSDGIRYEIYENHADVSTRAVISKKVTRYIRYYSAIIEPTAKVYWTEKLDTYTTLSGWLTYTGSYHRNYEYNTTDAEYIGTITGRI